jgi:hypothetical protein
MYNSSRHTIANKQQNRHYRPGYALPPHVKAETQVIDSTEQVIEIHSALPAFWVASKWRGRYYHVMVDGQGNWTCSASDDRVSAAMIAVAQAYKSFSRLPGWKLLGDESWAVSP